MVLQPPARSWVKAVVSRDCQLVQFAAGMAVVALEPPRNHWTLVNVAGSRRRRQANLPTGRTSKDASASS